MTKPYQSPTAARLEQQRIQREKRRAPATRTVIRTIAPKPPTKPEVAGQAAFQF